MRTILLVLVYLLSTASAHAATPMQRMQQLVDYVGVDYPGAVNNGSIANSVEYAEMLDFVATIQTLARSLPESGAKEDLEHKARRLSKLVMDKADADEVARVTGKLRQMLINSYDIAVTPGHTPDLARGKALFSAQCTSCHGVEGRGDGPLANTLEPAPTDFTDLERYRRRTFFLSTVQELQNLSIVVIPA